MPSSPPLLDQLLRGAEDRGVLAALREVGGEREGDGLGVLAAGGHRRAARGSGCAVGGGGDTLFALDAEDDEEAQTEGG